MSLDPVLARPRVRLRTKLTALLVLVAAPAALIGAGAVVILDRLIAEEIRLRGRETFAATERAIRSQTSRVEEKLDRLAAHDALRRLARTVDHPAAVERAEDLASSLSASSDVDILGIAALAGPSQGTLISSAHLPDAVGDTIPAYLSSIAEGTAEVAGLGHELVAGNPPALVPAVLAARRIDDEAGHPALLVYGGVRLDADFLEAIARVGGASLILEAPGQPPRRFPDQSPSRRALRPVGAVALPVLGSTRSASIASTTQIRVLLEVGRLEQAQARFLLLSGGWLLFALAVAFALGAFFARRIADPIVELSQAAAAIGGGDLEIQVPPAGNDEVGLLVTAFNDMVTEIRDSRDRLARAERVAAWREAARRIAHEIKNPLFPMQMAMETLRKAFKGRHHELDKIADESTQVVLDEIRSLSRMVSEFSEFARLPRPKLEPVDALSLLEHASGLYGTVPANVRIDLPRDQIRARALAPAMADRDQIARALTNLVKNAIEAIGQRGGTIALDARQARRGGRLGLSLEVTDDGPGMTEEVRERVFAPYFTTKPEGTGLGLSIVERVIAEHEGAIDVESEVGRGTRFRIWLPIAPLAGRRE